MLTPEQIQNLPADTKKEYLKTALLLEERKKEQGIRDDFLQFVKYMWPEFIEGEHHKIMADKFNRIANGEIKRVIINMAPRHTKSEFASNFLPAWMIGKQPDLKIIQATNNAELAVRFGRKAKSLIDTEDYQKIFNTRLREDSQAAGKWETEQGGEYYAAGVGGSITGRGADLLIIDDPHSEQDAMNPASYDRVYEWYTSGPRQRLQPGGRIIVVMTRWSVADLTGKLMKAQKEPKADQWEVIEFPAILPSGNPVWPGYWKLEELESVKASVSILKWNAQYQQNPTAEEGSLIKREWWKEWKQEEPPPCEAIIQSWDTAFLKTQRADYSACTTWGVFYHPDDTGKDRANLILLHAFKEKYEFPELKKAAHEAYWEWEPDQMIVEAKAAGSPLIFELRAMGIPVTEFTPSRGQDKIARVNAITDLFASGVIWSPSKRWAEEVIEECAAFPSGDHDDLVDSTTQALLRFRQGGWIRSNLDDEDDEMMYRRPVDYY